VTDALACLRSRTFDLVLLDISLPERTGFELLRTIKKEWPALPGADVERLCGGSLCCARIQGRRGRLSQQAERDGFADRCDRKVAAGGKFLTPALAERSRSSSRSRDDRAVHETLSDRELAITQADRERFEPEANCRAPAHQPEDGDHLSCAYLEKTGLASNAELTRYMLEKRLLD
jgi:DNA-binding NarL/FixJ family response regulator